MMSLPVSGVAASGAGADGACVADASSVDAVVGAGVVEADWAQAGVYAIMPSAISAQPPRKRVFVINWFPPCVLTQPLGAQCDNFN